MASSDKPGRAFLSAEWRDLAMLNYVVDPRILRDLVPAGTELDEWNGKSYVSMVGFMFLKTRLLGVPLPGYRNFEEVNLRFYVRRRDGNEWKRGVVFVREIVPKVAVAVIARVVYGEKYSAMRMRHRIEHDPSLVEYEWRHRGRWNWMIARGDGHLAVPPEESEESFIAEHYWGYARQRNGGTMEYRVEHPPWEVMKASVAALECDAAALYGQEFAEYLGGDPDSAFIAQGSEVRVYPGRKVRM
jgi:uncharacterized protein